jgi:hypothetical protein
MVSEGLNGLMSVVRDKLKGVGTVHVTVTGSHSDKSGVFDLDPISCLNSHRIWDSVSRDRIYASPPSMPSHSIHPTFLLLPFVTRFASLAVVLRGNPIFHLPIDPDLYAYISYVTQLYLISFFLYIILHISTTNHAKSYL